MVWGGGQGVAFRARRRARIACTRAGAYRSALAGWALDTLLWPRLVQNPYVRLVVVQIDLNGLQGVGAPSGYPGLACTLIACCRPV